MISVYTGIIVPFFIVCMYLLFVSNPGTDTSVKTVVKTITYIILFVAYYAYLFSGMSTQRTCLGWTTAPTDSDTVYKVLAVMDGDAYYGVYDQGRIDSVSVKNAVTGASVDAVRMVRATDITGIFYMNVPCVYLTDETAAELDGEKEEMTSAISVDDLFSSQQ